MRTGQGDRVSPGRCAERRRRHRGRLQAGHARHHKPGRHARHDTARRRLIKACEKGCAVMRRAGLLQYTKLCVT